MSTVSLAPAPAGVPWKHGMLGGAALAVSMGLHAVVLERIPELPVRRKPPLASYARNRPVRLHEVTRSPPPSVLTRPPELEAVQPLAGERLRQETRLDATAVPALIPEPLPEDVVPFAGVDAPMDAASPLRDRARWEPRQDILVIERRRIRDDSAALPRVLIPPPPSPTTEPDFGFAAVPSEALSTGPVRTTAVGLSTGRGGWVAPAPVLPEVRFDPLPDAEDPLRPDAVPSPVEALEDVAPFEAVEDLLDLELRLFQPPDEPEALYFELAIRRKDATRMPTVPRDVLILQDCSESMTQRKLDQCKDGLLALLRRVGPEDRLEIVAFREDVETCFGMFRPASPLNKAAATTFIDRMEARGKTDVYATLEALMRMPRSPGRPLLCVLVTDGRPTAGLVDSSEIIESFTRSNAGTVSVFALGGGTRVNRFLLDLLSYRNRGDSRVVERRQAIPEALAQVGDEIRRPVLTDLRYQFSGLAAEGIVPETLTHLYLDRPLSLYGRVSANPSPAGVQIVGRGAEGDRDMVFPIPWGDGLEGDAAIRTRWAWHSIYHRIAEHIRSGRPEALSEAHRIADRYGLQVPYGRDVVYR